MKDEELRRALKACLSGADFSQAEQQAVLKQIRGGKQIMKTKITLAFACVVAFSLALGGFALAAGMGLFGQFGTQAKDSSGERLLRLDEAASDVGITLSVRAPEAEDPLAEAATDREKLLARQYGRSFKMTLDQSYCDGNRLYYTYTLTTPDLGVGFQEEPPTGFDVWDREEPGETYAEAVPYCDNDQLQQVADWMTRHAVGFAWYDWFSLGDGADLADGTVLTIVDSDYEWVDGHTRRGYQEVLLPEGAAENEKLDLVFTLHYGSEAVLQDEKGVHRAYVLQPENRGMLQLPLTLDVNGQTNALVGSAAFDAYSAKASLKKSDIDISGEVEITAPPSWSQSWVGDYNAEDDYVCNYLLVADGAALPNLDGGLRRFGNDTYALNVRFDLPESFEDLKLRPVREQSGERPDEEIVLQ